MTPVKGKDVLFQIFDGVGYTSYACATDCSIETSTELKSVKTIGDGNWGKYKAQKNDYQVSLSGVIVLDTAQAAFDLLNYQIQGLDVPFQMFFEDADTGTISIIRGNMLANDSRLGGGSEGFASSDFSFQGNGAYQILDPSTFCESVITTIQLIQQGANATVRITGHTGNPTRYDYSIDGGGLLTVFTSTYVTDLPLGTGYSGGTHTVQIIPYCSNGLAGTNFNGTITIAPSFSLLGRLNPAASPSATCGGSPTRVFTSNFNVGGTLYTDAAHANPAIGHDYVVSGSRIWTIDRATGIITSDTGTFCPDFILSNWYVLDNSTGTICGGTAVRLYGFSSPGDTLYTDEAMTIPATTFTFFTRGGPIISIDPSSGIVGSYTGFDCNVDIGSDVVFGSDPSICTATTNRYYMPTIFSIGVIIFTDNALNNPLLGESIFGNADNGHIYNMDPATGEILSDTGGAPCPVGVPVNVVFGNDTSTICSGSGLVAYVTIAFAPGEILYSDIGLNTPVTGFVYVVNADAMPAEIFNLNTSTGVIGSDTGQDCLSLARYDLDVQKRFTGTHVAIDVTDEITLVTTTYTFNESALTKNFPAIMLGSSTYTITVRASAFSTITIRDGLGSSTTFLGDTTGTATRNGVVPGPGGVYVNTSR